MAKKIIPGKRKLGIISNDTMKMLNKSIRNNYALFGDRANDIKAYCIKLKNLVYGEPFNLDDVKVSRYTIKKDSPYYEDAKRLIRLLEIFLPVPSEHVPNDSILREFIGGSYFK